MLMLVSVLVLLVFVGVGVSVVRYFRVDVVFLHASVMYLSRVWSCSLSVEESCSGALGADAGRWCERRYALRIELVIPSVWLHTSYVWSRLCNECPASTANIHFDFRWCICRAYCGGGGRGSALGWMGRC